MGEILYFLFFLLKTIDETATVCYTYKAKQRLTPLTVRFIETAQCFSL